jgi:ankyrin repeat protein
LEAVKFLVEEVGADLNAYSNDGLTALHVAAFTWADGIIEYLVSKGARLDAEDKYGQTPLSVAEGDPNTLVDSSERGAHAAMMSSTAKLIRKLMGAPEPQGQDAALVPAN